MYNVSTNRGASKMSKRIVIIGAEPGGLAAAMLLSSKGYDVNVHV